MLLHCSTTVRPCTYPDNPIAFPPSMEVRCRRYDYREVIGRVESGTETKNRVGNCGRELSQDAYRDVGGTTTWMCEVELRRERQPRVMQEQLPNGDREPRREHSGREIFSVITTGFLSRRACPEFFEMTGERFKKANWPTTSYLQAAYPCILTSI